jgi:DNA-binding response OmpR family regulator
MKKILLIEDDVDLFALLKYNLENEGFQLVGSHEGKGAVELCERERPDLILLDIMLPDADGLDLCRRLRNHYQPELRSAPIIFITARAEESDRIVGLEVGASDYIVKPFFVREVIARIRVLTENKRVTRLSSGDRLCQPTRQAQGRSYDS